MAVVWVFALGSFLFFFLFDRAAERMVGLIEQETAKRDLERAFLALEKETSALETVAKDWAARGDVAAYVQSGNPGQLQVALDQSVFSRLDIEFLVLIDAWGRVVYARGLDPRTGQELSLPSQILWTRPESGELKGVAVTPVGPVLVAAVPIPATAGSSPQGVVVMARLFEAELVERLASLTRLTLSVRAFSAEEVAGLPPRGQLATGQVFYTLPVSEEETASLVAMRDVFGQPRLVLQVNSERTALRIVRLTRRILQLLLLLAVGASFAITWVWLDRSVLSRLTRLTRKVAEAAPDPGLAREFLEVGGNDELAVLSKELGRMLWRIEEYQGALREREKRYQEVVENAAEGIVVVQDGRIRLVNRAALRYTGYTEGEMIGRNFGELVHPEDLDAVRREYAHLLAVGEALLGFRFRILTKGGEVRWAEANSVAVDWEGRPAVLHFLNDITPRRVLEEELERLTAEKSLILDTLTERVIFVDRELHIIWANRAAAEAARADPYYLIGAKCYQVLQRHEAPCEGCPALSAMDTGLPCTAELSYEEGRYCQVSASPVRDEKGKVGGAVVSILDVTERRRYEEELRYLVSHDSLTGLYNRAFFREEMERLGAGREFPLTILVADMDGLKIINDTWGHAKGDEMLVACAEVLKSTLRRSDILARVGGDEFAVLLPRTDERAAREIVHRIQRAAEAYNALRKEVPLLLSVGWATCQAGEEPLEEIYRRADEKMYQEKAANREASQKRLEQQAGTAGGRRGN